MTFEDQWREAARSVTVRGSIAVLFSVIKKKNGGYYVVGEMMVPDSEAPDIVAPKVRIHAEVLIDINTPPDFHVFWHVARNMFLHELEEQICVNGVRAMDPHKTKKRGINVNKDSWYVA